MNYFTTKQPVAETKTYIKSLKAWLQFCILGMNKNSCLVISNSKKLSEQLLQPGSGFQKVTIAKRDCKNSRGKKYKNTWAITDLCSMLYNQRSVSFS
jgi:hypothetical protein